MLQQQMLPTLSYCALEHLASRIADSPPALDAPLASLLHPAVTLRSLPPQPQASLPQRPGPQGRLCCHTLLRRQVLHLLAHRNGCACEC